MIEVIYKEEKQEGTEIVSVPRNIRQIGFISGDCRIYIEDYVYTFLGRTASSEKILGSKEGCAAVLTGEIKWQEGIAYVFVKGAILAKNMEAAREHIDFSEEIWADIHEEQEKYFENQEIVGWFFSQAECPVAATEVFTKAHVKNFGGEKVLMLMDPVEREDGFFRYENGNLVRQRGYYIYYEKNPQMQAYMIEKNSELQIGEAEKCEDKAVKNFRRIITDKKQDAQERASVFSYAATACLAAAVLFVGVNFYRNYQSVKSIETEIRQASSVIVEEVTPVPEKGKKNSEGTELKKKTIPTQLPEKKEISPTRSPSVTKSLEREKIQKEEDSAASGDEIYREESDVRKAQRRKALEEKKNETEVSSGGIHESYVIKPGDTLFQISMARYGNMDAMAEICRLNGLSLEEIIYPGQVIVLP